MTLEELGWLGAGLLFLAMIVSMFIGHDKPLPYRWCNFCDGELTERGWCKNCRKVRPM